ncbi:MAG: hypothetical protein IJ867_09020 [Clostridia bacterium]|nr:hypothetical protein [Clostridia bacterium]
MRKKGIYKHSTGITLIALIITIIVLLILAGVTINVVVGDNGVLTQAQKAKEATDLAKEKELVELAISSSYSATSNYTKISGSELRNELEKEFDDYIFNENADGTFTIKIENREYQISETGSTIYIEHVVDTTPGVLAGSGTESSPYLIESVEDLVVFSYNVRSGNSYEGKYIDLKTNLNLASSNSYVDGERIDYEEYGYDGKLRDKIQEVGFIPIGALLVPPDEDGNINYAEYTYFKGNFNGNYYTISNFNINADIEGDGWAQFGLFSVCGGDIKNLNVIGNIICKLNVTKFSGIGILSSGLKENGTIKNCRTSGKIVGYSEDSSFNYGGLVGSCSGNIENCYNSAEISGYVAEIAAPNNGVRLGGICGVIENSGIVKNCYNTGNILLDNNTKDCSQTANYYIGGISGRISGSVEKCYSIGLIANNLSSFKNIRLGTITGWTGATTSINNCYSLSNANSNFNDTSIIMSETEMKSDNFVDNLNSGLETPVWKKDTGINNGYPILIWQ